jgi:phosphohistidine phosphatase
VKSILLLRHAKSDWNASFGNDHERPLNKRGRRAASVVGKFVQATDQITDLVLSSTATRARTTAELAVEAGRWKRPVELVPELYGASTEMVLDLIQRQNESDDSLMIVGHEPTCSDLVAKLTGGGHVQYPTAALARIDFHVDGWSEVDFGMGQLIFLIPPRILKKSFG